MIKLKPRMVPYPLWKVCLRNSLTQSEWLNKVSRPIRQAAGFKCEICGDSGNSAVPEFSSWELCCDEVWAYDETGTPPKASLVDLDSICWWCNGMVHWGRTRSVESHETQIKIFKHAMKVNNATAEDMQKIIGESFEAWKRQSLIPVWDITWENWGQLLDKKVNKNEI